MRRLVTADDLAAWLGVAPRTVSGWAREGRIPSIRISHKVVRYDLNEVVRTLRDQARQSGNAARGEVSDA